MAGIMGLIGGKEFDDNSFHSFNNRRQVYHNFPNGGAPLMGLLSLMDTDPTDSPLNFGWNEKRYQSVRTTTAAQTGGTTGAIATTSGGTPASPQTLTFSTTAGTTTYYLAVADDTYFQVNDLITILEVPLNGGGTTTVRGLVVNKGSGELGIQVVTQDAGSISVLNTNATNVGLNVVKTGSAYAEGSTSGQGRLIVPVNPNNHTQIFKDSVEFTGSALKIPADFDKTGLYREDAKDSALDHMCGLELQFLLGRKGLVNGTLGANNSLSPTGTTQRRTTGGVLYFLEEWEKAGGGAPGYRPGGLALTSDNDDEKRIIENVSGTLTKSQWNTYVERAFRKANNKSYEKIVFCGNGALKAVDELIEARIVKQVPGGDPLDAYRMRITTVETSWGILHFKTHPLLTDQPGLYYSMFIIDVPFLKYRALNDRDTTLLPNRQNNDEDGRKDIWLTEAGLELRFPEAHMLIKNVQAITV
jgi:hypothetical protein